MCINRISLVNKHESVDFFKELPTSSFKSEKKKDLYVTENLLKLNSKLYSYFRYRTSSFFSDHGTL